MGPQPIVIYGPPGTGKTRTLMGMIKGHVDCGGKGRVLFCSYTKAAAAEAMSRWPVEHEKWVDISTIHSCCFRALGLSRAQTVDDMKLRSFGQAVGQDMTEESAGRAYCEILDYARAVKVSYRQAYEHSERPGTWNEFDAFALSYDSWKDQYGFMDFSDMLNGFVEAEHPHFGPYGLIVIDEAQDLTPLQWDVIYKMIDLQKGAEIVLALDDDQAIYTWAGADPQGGTKFEDRYKCTRRILDQSYRVPGQVHALAHKIIQRVTDRVDKVYKPRRDADGIVVGGELSFWPDYHHLQLDTKIDSLILYGDRFIRAEMESELQARGLMYTALNGYDAPVQTRAGRAWRIIKTKQAIALNDTDLETIHTGLSPASVQVWESSGPKPILDKLYKGDLHCLQVPPRHWDYFRNASWTTPLNIKLSTIHSAKGMEAAHVHLLSAQSFATVRQAAIDPASQHRVMYVAVTRAKEKLFIYGGDSEYGF